MSNTFYPRDRVAREFSVSTATLLRYEGRGLVRPIRDGSIEGYGPEEIRRVWTVLTFHRDLGVNLAGIEVILHLREQMAAAHHRLDRLARSFRETLDEGDGPDADG